TMAMPRFAAGTSFMRSPSIRRFPPVIGSSPAIIRSSVDFPQPEGPTKTTNSPGSTSRSTPCTTCTSPYFLKTFCRTTLVDMLGDPLRQPARIFGMVRPDGKPHLLVRMRRMIHRRDDFECAARIRARHRQFADTRQSIVEARHLRGEAWRDGRPVLEQGYDLCRGRIVLGDDRPGLGAGLVRR